MRAALVLAGPTWTCLVLSLSLLAPPAAERPLLAQGQAPRAVVPQPDHDFGSVKQGDRLVHAFTIRNEGVSPLTILRIDLSVPGTKTRFKKTIAPGESGQITMEWDTSNVQGEFEAAAVVLLNDPDQARVSLSLRAIVEGAIEFVPFPEVFFSAYRDETPERVVQIVNNEERPLNITGAESSSSHYDVSVAAVRAGFAYDVRVKVRAGVPFGRYAGEPIYLHTDSPVRPRLQLLANLFVKPDLYAAPEEVNFGAVGLEAMTRDAGLAALLKQSVTLANREGPVEIERIETDVPALQITQTPSAGSSQRFRFDMTLARDKIQKGPIEGSVRIVTTNPAIPAVIIPVRGEVR